MSPRLLINITKLVVSASIFVIGIACGTSNITGSGDASSPPTFTQAAIITPAPEPEIGEPIESFSDELNIGRAKENKIQIDIFELANAETAYKPNKRALVKFYSLIASNKWELRQTIKLESHALADAAPETNDFNNDGLKDITFRSDTAARGANDVRTLLIYDKANDQLIHIKNSEDYPNLAFNRTLNCIDSFMIHGSSTTVFLRLEGDILKEFASVGTGADETGNCCGLTVTVTDNAGQETVILRRRIKEDDIYTRFRTFNPPRP